MNCMRPMIFYWCTLIRNAQSHIFDSKRGIKPTWLKSYMTKKYNKTLINSPVLPHEAET